MEVFLIPRYAKYQSLLELFFFGVQKLSISFEFATLCVWFENRKVNQIILFKPVVILVNNRP